MSRNMGSGEANRNRTLAAKKVCNRTHSLPLEPLVLTPGRERDESRVRRVLGIEEFPTVIEMPIVRSGLLVSTI